MLRSLVTFRGGAITRFPLIISKRMICAALPEMRPSTVHFQFTLRNFRASQSLFAKKKKNKGVSTTEEEEFSLLPSIALMSDSMDGRLSHLKEEFSRIRGGQLSSEQFAHIRVNAYGSTMSLTDAGHVAIKAGNKLTVAVYDPALVSAVSVAIRDCGMSLNPSTEGSNVVVPIPKPSLEARQELAKLAAKSAEKVISELGKNVQMNL